MAVIDFGIMITWNEGSGAWNELIPLDRSTPATSDVRETFEFDASECICYRPRPSTTREVLCLEYVPGDHPAELRDRVDWGQLTIAFRGTKPVRIQWRPNGGKPFEPKFAVVDRHRLPKRVPRLVLERVEQQTMRIALIATARATGSVQCSLSGPTPAAALDAAHLKAHSKRGKAVIENSLLLRADIHRLFDAGEFRFGSDGEVIVRPGSELARIKSKVDRERGSYEWLFRKLDEPTFRRCRAALSLSVS